MFKVILSAALLSCTVASVPAANYRSATVTPPPLVREFRGLWIATVANIDWPSRPGLSTAEQKKELIAILDRAAELKLNAVVFQVRPACDAFYASTVEPWSEYLTGAMGRAPAPYYDPLAFAVTEAHRRGLELHAWFNPYRALHFSAKSPVSPNHVIRTHPEFTRKYGKYIWLDPGEPGVREYSLAAVMDVVRRYDIDGVHFDDYFYPDRVDAGANSDFPDDASWRKVAGRTELSRDDWRRENVNTFIQHAYESIKAAKPWVKFGISPRGIWRPGFPASVKGMDAYATIYADSRRWLAEGWLDYFAPQLYWPDAAKERSFSVLLDWWAEQNVKHRHLWPGINVARADQWPPDEIPNQIRATRKEPGVSGYICYNTSSVMHNSTLADQLAHELNSSRALVPASPWLPHQAPRRPEVYLSGAHAGAPRIIARPAGDSGSGSWLIQTRQGDSWSSQVLPGRDLVRDFSAMQPDAIVVTWVDRFGATSAPVAFEKQHGPMARMDGDQ